MSSASRRPTTASKVTSFAWNESGTCLAIGTIDGFQIYSSESTGGKSTSFREVVSRKVRGGVGHIAVFRQSNVIAFSGADEQSSKILTLWCDDNADVDDLDTVATSHGIKARERNCIAAQISFPSPIVALRLHPNVIVAAEEACIHVLDASLTTIESYGTPTSLSTTGASQEGARGLFINDNCIAVASYPYPLTPGHSLGMLIMGPSMGSVRCLQYYEQENGKSKISCKIAAPHQRPLRCVCISPDGKLGASISENGTAIKLIGIEKGEVLRQLNRGTTPAAVNTMAFNTETSLLSCLSETGSVHCFAVALQQGGGGSTSGNASNPRSKIGSLSSAALSYAPSSFSGAKWVANVSAYASSEHAMVTFSLGGASAHGSATVVDDVENESSDTFSSTFAALALCPALVGRNGKSVYILVAQGNNELAVDVDVDGAVGFSGPRCKLVKLLLDPQIPKCERHSTHFFPREEL